MQNHGSDNEWQYTSANIFWGEIAPCDHVLQIYENDDIFLDTLTGFVGGGINSGDACVVIATRNHLKGLEDRLENFGIQIPALISEGRYIPLDAEETLSSFMINDWPDEELFNDTVSEILKAAHGKNNRKIRAFGEMVAILWASGNNGATVHLEHLWNRLCDKESFCLFCAYPKSGLTNNMAESINHICLAHTKMIDGAEKPMTRILYKETA